MYENIISLHNLFAAWEEFINGKKTRKDIAEFSLNLSQNIFQLHEDLLSKIYKHSSYQAFNISDPKPRNIHKATVRDRLLHHAIYRQLYPHFDTKFIHDSCSCRKGKGTHRAIKRLQKFGRKVSKNNTKTCLVLKCDVRKFFPSIDHDILLGILMKHDLDTDTVNLLWEIIESFCTTKNDIGLPLGNLTSQLLVNIYMNEFDHYMKHTLKTKYYIRYADDFVILSDNKSYLEMLLSKVGWFLSSKLYLDLHPDKVYIKTLASGVDFLGWVHFPDHLVLRTATKRRMFKKLEAANYKKEVLESYLGLLSHGNTKKLQRFIQK